MSLLLSERRHSDHEGFRIGSTTTGTILYFLAILHLGSARVVGPTFNGTSLKGLQLHIHHDDLACIAAL